MTDSRTETDRNRVAAWISRMPENMQRGMLVRIRFQRGADYANDIEKRAKELKEEK